MGDALGCAARAVREDLARCVEWMALEAGDAGDSECAWCHRDTEYNESDIGATRREFAAALVEAWIGEGGATAFETAHKLATHFGQTEDERIGKLREQRAIDMVQHTPADADRTEQHLPVLPLAAELSFSPCVLRSPEQASPARVAISGIDTLRTPSVAQRVEAASFNPGSLDWVEDSGVDGSEF